MLSQSAEYALKAVLFVARSTPDGPVGVGTISERLGMPRNYLSKILHQLARAGVLVSTRGRGGGFVLARPARDVTLVEVVAPFDAVGRRNEYCLLNRSACDATRPCAAHQSWQQVHETVLRFFEDTSLADLLGNGAAESSAPGAAAQRPKSHSAP